MKEAEQFIRLANGFGKDKVPFLFVIDFEMQKPILIRLDEINPKEILYDIDGKTNSKDGLYKIRRFHLKKNPVDFDEYKNAFDKVMKNLKAGNTYLLNLTFPTHIETDLSLEEIFVLSKAKYKLFYKNVFVVFSPETFIKTENGKIYSYPMKGTIDASIKNARQLILDDPKEKAEHITIVDLIRNDLSMVAENVSVTKFRYIDEIKTNDKNLLQVSSEVSGELPENFKEILGEIIFKLLPAGSISGAPKEKTVQIIRAAEIIPREYYTGVFGIFDGENLFSAVMIRFIENKNGNFYYRSGGGITALSNPESEYKELIDKVYVPII